MRHWPVHVLVTLLALLLAPDAVVAAAEPAVSFPVTVIGVADGDTLAVQLADGRTDTLRLLGIDAPESARPGSPPGCFAAESAARTREVALGRAGTLEIDVQERDRAGRLLGYLTLDGHQTSLNRQLLQEGFALPLTVGSNTAYSDDLRAAARAAQLSRQGIWSACDVADLPTIATAYPLDETPQLWADGPAIRLLLGTERDEVGTVLWVSVEARAAHGLGELFVAGDRPDDPAFSAPRTVACDGQVTCTDRWTGRPRGLGTYQLTARVNAVDGQAAEAQAGLRIIGRWQTIAARAAQVRERATEVRPAAAPTPPPSASQSACPAGFPVKALAPDPNGARRYLLPDDDGYADAVPQGCFQSEEQAQAAGWSR